MALREMLGHPGQLEKLEPLELLEEQERAGSMDEMELQGVRVRKERKVNTKFVHEITFFNLAFIYYI